jgi:hypothetical protein
MQNKPFMNSELPHVGQPKKERCAASYDPPVSTSGGSKSLGTATMMTKNPAIAHSWKMDDPPEKRLTHV